MKVIRNDPRLSAPQMKQKAKPAGRLLLKDFYEYLGSWHVGCVRIVHFLPGSVTLKLAERCIPGWRKAS